MWHDFPRKQIRCHFPVLRILRRFKMFFIFFTGNATENATLEASDEFLATGTSRVELRRDRDAALLIIYW